MERNFGAVSPQNTTDKAVPRERRLVTDVLESALCYARERDYRGWDYADGMSSPFREVLPDNRWINLVLQELPKRSPVNVRPLLGIPPRRNFKGCALFSSANVMAYELTGQSWYLDEAEALLGWLLEHRRDDPFGWGHNHDLQGLSRTIPRNTPDIVATTYVARAMMDLAEHRPIPEYASLPERISTFFREELCDTTPDGIRLRYEPTAPTGTYVLNANALAGSLLVELADTYEAPSLRPFGESLLDYVAAEQHPLGGWKYTDPPSASHLSMDNHHTGFILESYLRHRDRTGSDRYDDVINRGLSFYRDVLYDPNGAPRWDERRRYPRDIHGAAQGIITFAMADDRDFAARILGWTLEAMYDEGRFFYRQNRLFTRRFTLMRWCQAWMAYAIASYLAADAPHRQPLSGQRNHYGPDTIRYSGL